MTKISRRDALLALGAPACIAAPQVGGRTEAGSGLPQGVKAVWDLDKAYRESTPTRERLSINGLWRWQPAASVGETAPETGWGYLRVPESWPGGGQGSGGRTVFFANPDWTEKDLAGVTMAWQQRDVTVPREWNGRRIALTADYVNSYAAVYVDGKRAGEMRFPAGELDLTPLCRPGTKHTIGMLVMALPLKGVMLSFSDSAAARQVEGRVQRRGLCGDIYLVSTPPGPRITGVKVETSVRRWQITFEATLAALDPQGRYALRAVIKDGPREVARFTSRPFGAADLINGRTAITENWRPEKLWDTVAPNQYNLSVSLVDARAVTLDEALPVRFGFREFWIEGRDFYLNGSRIFLAALPIDNGQQSPAQASYDGTRATIQRFKSFGINFVYTHNYGCEPGTHLNFDEVLRAADDEGMLVSFSQPHFGQYDWTMADAETRNSYAQHAEFYVRVARNHPSVVCYSTSHNSCGYGEDMNPDMIDGIQSPRDPWALKNTSLALRAEEIIRRLDPSRFVYHHASGNLGTMHAINFYANWAPVQEMNEWFEHWATVGVKPVFTCEYAVPFMWDWAMYRGWYKGKREFGSAVAPWEFCVAEWNAQFLGARSYDIIEAEKANLRWEAEQFRKGRAWQRYDYPYNLNSQVFDERFKVVAMYLADNFRAFRTWGVSATSPWDYGGYWKTPASARATDLGTDIDWDKLQRPGPRPVYVQEQQAKEKLAFRPSATEPTVAAQALYRNYMPLLAYLAGKPAAFTSKDHNFLPGEAVEKQLIAINNSRRNVTGDCEWSLGTPGAAAASGKMALATGEQQRIPLKFQLPADLSPGSYDLRVRVRFDNGETQEDTLPIHVMARPAAPRASARIALFDPKGDTAKTLAAMGVRCATVDAGADLASYDTLIVGKGALTPDGPGPDIARVREGLKVIVFEQTGEVLEKRFGFRIAEYGMRTVFRRVPDHPLLAGIGEEHLRDWRGEATILPPRLSYERPAIFNYVPTVKWCGIPVTQRWRCGHRGSVASALIEKPACGDFLPVLDCGYALQYSPLLEYREGKGVVLFCQADVNGRTETDPAAAALARNILDYAAGWKAGVGRSVVYAGDPAGRRYLQSAGIAAAAYAGGGLSGSQALVVGPGGGRELSASVGALSSWVRSGGRVLAIGLDQEDANAFLPFHLATVNKEHIAQYFEPFGADSPFAGISPAEVHNRDPRTLPLVAAGATVVGNGVLAKADGANVVFSQLAPWQFDYSAEKMNVKRTFRRVACLTARLLANMGAVGGTPLLARFASPANAAEKRWLDGLYLDAPEEWDDPYRFFRW